MDNSDTGERSNSSWFASAIDASLDSGTEGQESSSQDDEKDNPKEDD
jgi:hypothetical protein